MYVTRLPGVKKVRLGECANPLCYAIAHYSAEEWEGKARMARARRDAPEYMIEHYYDDDDELRAVCREIPRVANAFDDEALRRFPA
jgi:hypothetical protein